MQLCQMISGKVHVPVGENTLSPMSKIKNKQLKQHIVQIIIIFYQPDIQYTWKELWLSFAS